MKASTRHATVSRALDALPGRQTLTEREEDGELRAPSFYILSAAVYRCELYNRFRVLREVELRVVALWLSSISLCVRISYEYIHPYGAEIESSADGYSHARRYV